MNKNTVRQELKKIDIIDKETKSAIICSKLISSEEYVNARSIFVYLATDREVATDVIVKDALLRNKRVFVPITTEVMRLAKINEKTQFGIKKFGIREPKTPILCDAIPDLSIIPLVGFDRNLNRLGHGAGYYDKWLNGKNTKKIALAFAEQEVDDVYSDEYDVKMDKIITDKEILV